MGVRDDELHPAQAAAGEAAQELDPERLGLAVADGHAEHLAPAIGIDADRHDHGDGDDLVVAPDLHVGGVEPDIGPVALDRSGQEGVHALVDLGTQARDLALADALHPERLDQLVDRAGGDALDVGLLDHGRQRLLGQPARLEETRKVAAFAQLWDTQLDRASPCMPVPVAIAVTLVGAALTALTVPGAA
jgi:hypothetical protein